MNTWCGKWDNSDAYRFCVFGTVIFGMKLPTPPENQPNVITSFTHITYTQKHNFCYSYSSEQHTNKQGLFNMNFMAVLWSKINDTRFTYTERINTLWNCSLRVLSHTFYRTYEILLRPKSFISFAIYFASDMLICGYTKLKEVVNTNTHKRVGRPIFSIRKYIHIWFFLEFCCGNAHHFIPTDIFHVLNWNSVLCEMVYIFKGHEMVCAKPHSTQHTANTHK